MTLQSNLALPPSAFKPLSRCVHEAGQRVRSGISLAGAPAQSEEDIGTVKAITTAEELEADIRTPGSSWPRARAWSGVTGALANDCYHNDVPAAVLVVHANPYLPDPGPPDQLSKTHWYR